MTRETSSIKEVGGVWARANEVDRKGSNNDHFLHTLSEVQMINVLSHIPFAFNAATMVPITSSTWFTIAS